MTHGLAPDLGDGLRGNRGDFSGESYVSEPDPQELLDHLANLRLRGLAPTTIRQRRYIVRNLHSHLADHGATLLGATEPLVEGWQATLNRAGHGMRSAVNHARGFYRWAVWDGRITDDPSLRLVRPKVPRGLPRPIGTADLDAALRFAPARIKPWLMLAVEAGLRAKEIAELTAADLLTDFDPPLLRVHGKGDKERLVPMTPALRAALRDLPRRGPLFPRLRGDGPVTASIVSEQCCRYLHSLGIESTTHTLRHRFGTDVQEQCGDIRITQELLGHASPATTAIYTKFSNARAADVVLAVSQQRRAPMPVAQTA